jgi:hypothetical protein
MDDLLDFTLMALPLIMPLIFILYSLHPSNPFRPSRSSEQSRDLGFNLRLSPTQRGSTTRSPRSNPMWDKWIDS